MGEDAMLGRPGERSIETHRTAAACLPEMEVRGNTEEVADHIERRARQVIAAAASLHEVEAEIDIVGQTLGGPCDERAREIVERSVAIGVNVFARAVARASKQNA